MKPYDYSFPNTTIEIIAIDVSKPDTLVWKCTEEQGYDWEEIRNRVKASGYSNFIKRETTESEEYFTLED